LMEGFPMADDSKLTIGLLHADINVQSNYNPTKLTDLAGRGVAAWVLGHVHAARQWASPVAFYPGSPQALDAGEIGVHGVHWLEIEGSQVTVSELVPRSTLRFESVELEIGPEELVDEVISRYIAKSVAGDERLSLRVVLRRREGANPSLPPEGTHLDRHFYEIVDVRDVIEPNLDLAEEALQSDARGQAARLLLGLEGRGAPTWIREAQTLVAQVQAEMETNRRKLKLGGREEFRQLEVVPDMESIQAVRSSLESVLAATARGAR
jgi:DNA repair exonuclease SbcCD nuclease subunit